MRNSDQPVGCCEWAAWWSSGRLVNGRAWPHNVGVILREAAGDSGISITNWDDCAAAINSRRDRPLARVA